MATLEHETSNSPTSVLEAESGGGRAAPDVEPTPLYVLGTNGNLWLESPGWQQHGSTWVDGNVQAFTPDPQKPGYVYVEGTDHNLWLESPGWQQHGRTWIDGNVQAFTPYASGYLYVEGTDHNLWLESPGWEQHGRTWVDGNVQAFTPDPYAAGYLYVEGTDHNLWLESPGWEQHGAPGSTATSRPSPPTPMPPATCTWRGPTTISGWSPPAGSSTGGHLGRRQRPGLRPGLSNQ